MKRFSIKKDTVILHPLFLVLGMILIFSSPGSARDILIQDSFSLDGGKRTVGVQLSGTPPENSRESVEWRSAALNRDGRIDSNGKVVSAEGASVEMRISIPDFAIPTTVSATVVSDSSDWMAVGFLASDEAGARAWFEPGEVLLWVFLKPSGAWRAFVNGVELENVVASGTIPGFSPEEPARFGLTFDPVTSRGRVFLEKDGEEVSLHPENGGWFPVSLPEDVPITAVGFRINADEASPANSAWLDDFLVISGGLE